MVLIKNYALPDMEMKLSIIVPVYNASRYLHRCVDSLLAQGLEVGEYEIILVNDGSKDDSLEICRDYERQNPAVVRMLTHDNQGVAFTRNQGIKAAQGDYFCFVDADDYLIPGGYRYLIDTYWDKSIDILSFWALTIDQKMQSKYQETNEVTGEICREIEGQDFLCHDVQTFVVTSLFRRSFIIAHQLAFTELSIAEDVLFSVEVYLKNPRIRQVSSRIYRYELHEDSAIHRRDIQSVRKAIASYQVLLHSLRRYALENQKNQPLYQGIQRILWGQLTPFMSRILSSDYSVAEFRTLKSDLVKQGILPVPHQGKMLRMIDWIFATPSFIKVYQFLYQRIFLPYIYPRLSRN